MCIYKIYVKEHNKTGLKYLGFTTQVNHDKYLGSGIRWSNHLKKHGHDIKTTILKECETKEQLKYWGEYYSILFNIVDDERWANLIVESGDGVIPNKEIIEKRIQTRKTNNIKMSENSKKKMLETKFKNNTVNVRTPENIKKQLITRKINNTGLDNPEIQAKRQKTLKENNSCNFSNNNPSKITVSCIYCRKIVTISTLTRWHGQNCKKIRE